VTPWERRERVDIKSLISGGTQEKKNLATQPDPNLGTFADESGSSHADRRHLGEK